MQPGPPQNGRHDMRCALRMVATILTVSCPAPRHLRHTQCSLGYHRNPYAPKHRAYSSPSSQAIRKLNRSANDRTQVQQRPARCLPSNNRRLALHAKAHNPRPIGREMPNHGRRNLPQPVHGKAQFITQGSQNTECGVLEQDRQPANLCKIKTGIACEAVGDALIAHPPSPNLV